MLNISIIGAGLGGLATACLLATKGHRVTVYEKNASYGGKMNQIVADGFRFDTGPSLLTLPEILDEVFRLCGTSLEEQISYRPVSPLCRYHFSDGNFLESFSNHTEALEAIRNLAPEDEQNYLNFLKYAANLYDITSSSFLKNPLQRFTDLSKVKLQDIFQIDAFKTVSQRVEKSFASEYLRLLFKRFATYNGSSPFQAPATLNVISHLELNKGGYYVDGGMFNIAIAFFNLANSLGVTFKFNSRVDEISLKNDKVTGLVTENGACSADLIVSNSDASETYLNLINKPSLFNSRIIKLEPSSSGFVLLLGCSKKFELTHHNVYFSKNYRHEFDEIFTQLVMPSDPTIYIANTSYTNPDHAIPNGSNLFILVNAPYLSSNYSWTKHSEAYGNFLIKELENRGLKGLSKSILYRNIINPKDFYEKYLSNRGSIYGTSSNQRLSAFMRPGNKSPWIKNLYLTGGSTHPGGGIPLVLLSALNVDKLIERDYLK